MRGLVMYEEKKKRFFFSLAQLYLTETTPPLPPHHPISTPLSQTVSLSHPNPRRISTLPPLSFVNVFISKRHLTLCTYSPVWNKGWLGVGGPEVRRSGGGGGAGLFTPLFPPITIHPTFYFTYRRLVSFCFYSSGAWVKDGEKEMGGEERG